MLTTRPASYRLTLPHGHADLCADCRGALRRNAFLHAPQLDSAPLTPSAVLGESVAPLSATCTWCL